MAFPRRGEMTSSLPQTRARASPILVLRMAGYPLPGPPAVCPCGTHTARPALLSQQALHGECRGVALCVGDDARDAEGSPRTALIGLGAAPQMGSRWKWGVSLRFVVSLSVLGGCAGPLCRRALTGVPASSH